MINMTPPTSAEKSTALWMHGMTGAMIASAIMPFIFAAFLCLFMMIGILIAAYALRNDAPEGHFLNTHMNHIIRTIWVGNLVAVVSVMSASLLLFLKVDNRPLDPCMGTLLSLTDSGILPDPQSLAQRFGVCGRSYMQANLGLFVAAAIIAAIPPFLYFLLRWARGFSRALKGRTP